MPEGDTILGLIEVLEGPRTRLKQAASELLVEIGDAAVGRLQMSLRDRDAKPWVTDTLVDIRERRDPGGYASDQAAGEAALAGGASDETCGDDRAVRRRHTADESGDDDDEPAMTAATSAATTAPTSGGDDSTRTSAGDDSTDERGGGDDVDEVDDGDRYEASGEAAADPAADPAGTSGGPPSATAMDRDYDAFVARFKRETGQR